VSAEQPWPAWATADYAALKRVLAIRHPDNREAYSTAKSDFIRKVVA
jgi:GrpB-like predicted nucleotidyltransferase (UPF0157 family)